MAEHPKTILESFEEMTVSPTAGSPCRAEGEAAIPNEPPPKDKINFQLEVLFKGQISKKSARILPTASLFDFLEKLTKKKYLPTTSALGGAPLRNDQIKILHGANKDKLSELPLSKWSEPLWNYGFRDKDFVIVEIDKGNDKAESDGHILEREKRPRKNSKEEGEGGKKTQSLIGRIVSKRGSIKPEGNNEGEQAGSSTIGQLFGVPIESVASKGAPLMFDYGIPSFIEESLSIIRNNHCEDEGIFRLSGSLTAIKELKKKADLGIVPPFDENVDVHCLTGLIKLYLRELPEPLLTYTLYDCWKAVVECEIHEKKHELVKALLLALPKPNYCLLKKLMEFFADIATFEKSTKMGIVNLATLLGPNLIWTPKKDANDISTPTKITWFFISNFKTLFSEPDARSTILLAVGQCKYDFTPESEGEVPLRQGDIVFVTGNDDGQGWLEGTTAKNVAQGRFPSKYFEPISAFSAFDMEPLIGGGEKSPAVSSHASTISSCDQISRLREELDTLSKQLNQEIACRVALEDSVQTLQDNFHDMIQIVIGMKAKQKEIESQLSNTNPFDGGETKHEETEEFKDPHPE